MSSSTSTLFSITFLLLFCAISLPKLSKACTCATSDSIELSMCRADFAGLVYVKGSGPSNKQRDSYVVEWRQSFQMNVQAMRAFADFGSGLLWTQRKHTSCALKLQTNHLYLVFGRLSAFGQPLVSFCTALPYNSLNFAQRLHLNLITIRGLQCTSANVIV